MQKRDLKRATQWLVLLTATSTFNGFASLSAWADPVRISVEQFSKDPAKVTALKLGITKMRLNSKADPMSALYRTSFSYWANTHGYFGTGAHATNLTNYIAFRMPQCLGQYDKATCDAYYKHMANTSVPNDGFTDQVWGTCQHGNLFFLPWHRIFLHYFEKTLRKQSGNPHFALPYWNYFDNYNAALKGLSLPTLVRGIAAGTLNNEYRTPGLNKNVDLMDPTSADATQAFQYADFTGFSNQLQNQPHGAMHCAVGSGCTMPDIGFVPIAGLDPVFYMHHANIDRLWQCWMVKKANGQTINLAWAKANLGMPDSWYEQSYTFADENGSKVVRKVADVFNGTITVNYDNVSNCDTKATTPSDKALTSSRRAVLNTTLKAHPPMGVEKEITLGNSSVEVPLQPLSVTNAARSVESQKLTQVETGQSYLVLEDVKIKGAPALTYKIFLSSKANPEKSSYIATFNFFNLGPIGHDHQGAADSLGTLVYKVSSNLAELGITSASDIVVRFEPTNLMVGQKRKAQKEGNGVVVSNIRLESTPPASTPSSTTPSSTTTPSTTTTPTPSQK